MAKPAAIVSGLQPYSAYKPSGVEWLGEVPAHWRVRRIRTVASVLNGATPFSGQQSYWDGDIVWITPHDLGVLKGRYISTSGRKISRAGYESCGATVAPAKSVVISTRAPIGNLGILNTAACTNQGCRLLVPSVSIEPEHLYFCLWLARPELESIGQGTTFLELSRERLASFPLPLPPLAEQASIARYLDSADRRIRRCIQAKEQLVKLLEEQRQAIVNEAVTGRVDVHTGQPYPAYKDSGVEWLGAVPAHWETRPSKRTFTPRKEFARSNDIQLSATQAYGVIAQEDYEEKVGRKIVRIFRHLEKRRHVEVDDFVISMRSFQGGLERAWVSGCIRSSYIVLQPATTLDVGYFGHLFKSTGYIAALQSTAIFIRDGQDLTFQNFCGVDLPFPPFEEQRRIAQFLNRVTSDIAATIDCFRIEIDSLGEYRTRLIADVVTGKLDVRQAADQIPDEIEDPEFLAGSDAQASVVAEAAGQLDATA